MDSKKISEIRDLVDEVMYASTKKEAQHPLRRLEFEASGLKGTIDPNLLEKLSQVISYASQASGQVSNKQHWISCAEQSWYVFKTGVNQERQ